MGNLCNNHHGTRYRRKGTISRPINYSRPNFRNPDPPVSFTYISPKSPSIPSPQGLPNIGNTCFANAALQCILNTKVLKEHLPTASSNNKFTSELKSIFISTQSDSIDPSSLLSLVWRNSSVFHPGEQNDAHEFLVFLLDKLHEELKKPFKEIQSIQMTKAEKSWVQYMEKNYSIVSKEFQGQLKTTLVCQKCEKVKERFEPFMYLSLSINESGSCVDGCLEQFQREELLVGLDKWYCKNCKELVETKKKSEILRVPNYLIIHFKRFKNQHHKICGLVNYNEHLSISTAVQGQANFELYSKIKHFGVISGGHYIAEAKKNGIWYNFNDSSVSQTNFCSSSDTYLLFYKRI